MSTVERVLVIPAEARKDSFFDFTGYRETCTDRCAQLLDIVDDHYWFHERSVAEEDFTMLQIIPYVVISRPTENGQTEYYAYQRTSGGGDKRLYGAISIGLGGHVNPCDDTGECVQETLLNNIRRELDEEVDIFDARGNDIDSLTLKADRFKCIGEIYSDDSDVSRVHYGVVYELKLPANSQVALRETHKMRDFGWQTADDFSWAVPTEKLESWSRLIVESFDKEEDHASAV